MTIAGGETGDDSRMRPRDRSGLGSATKLSEHQGKKKKGVEEQKMPEAVHRAGARVVRAATRNRRSFAIAAASNPDIYDVVCVGGGPAGLSLLAALRSNPTTSRLRVALVEAQDLSKTRNWTLPADRFSNRCTT
ncbi:hypothetical protein HYQ46_000753 [Verticillium longisporum]|nr:hypothetical protein HYQ46_000753 [Verticillium longisporum]